METSVSLLERLRTSFDQAAWRRLDDLYRPLILRWLRRDPGLGDEAEDLAQEVMHVLIRELPSFHRQRDGSFRRWLRTVTTHRVLAHHRARRNRPLALGVPLEESSLADLKDVGAWNKVEIEIRGQSFRMTVNDREIQKVMLDEHRPVKSPAPGLEPYFWPPRPY
jgi:DNA-directed RNA polymerase specialized sigma24 family protein